MKILAIETSVKESSIAIMDNNDCYELFTDTMNDTAKSLPILVENALSKTKNSFQDLDAIAISMGPGSFTGLRVGLSYAKGLSLALDIPIVPISTFESMINIVKPNSYSIINTVIYSHSTFVYNAEYELKDNLYLPITEPTLVDISDIQYKKNSLIIYVGKEEIINTVNIENINSIILNASSIATLGNNNYDSLKTKSLDNLSPNYIGSFNLG